MALAFREAQKTVGNLPCDQAIPSAAAAAQIFRVSATRIYRLLVQASVVGPELAASAAHTFEDIWRCFKGPYRGHSIWPHGPDATPSRAGATGLCYDRSWIADRSRATAAMSRALSFCHRTPPELESGVEH